jgi:hypothetical protein
MYDALRMEITNTSAAPSTMGWDDYEYIFGFNSQIDADNTIGLNASEVFVPEPASAILAIFGAVALSVVWAISSKGKADQRCRVTAFYAL